VNISGNITFTKEALEKFDNDTLTFVAAHEIAHDKLGHVAKKIAVSSTITGALVVANVFLPGAGYLNHIINPTITNNYSKTQEYDADQMASDHCAQCFDMSIEKQITVMQKIEKISKSSGGGFWATHPSWENRIKNVATTTKSSSQIRNIKTTAQSPSPLMEGDQKHKEIKGIVLNDGNVVEGQLLEMSTDTVMIQTEDGKVSTYSFEKEVRGFVK
ncbi:MAG TPA: M48 family metalloprotease, partial [Smithellaceae bacterium]|nr:M48 family metalloprotease [Smithellaceae bacterium]